MKFLNLLIFNNSHTRMLATITMMVGVLFLSILSGVLAAYSNVILLVPLLALYGLFFILAAPVSWIIWIIFWAAFVVTGPSAYFIRFTQLQWLTVLMGAALLLPVLLHLLRSKNHIQSIPVSNDLFLPVIFLLLVIFSTVIDHPQFADFVNASRHYLFMWPLMLVFMFGLVRPEMLMQLWKALMPLAILQLPMALYQYFFVARQDARMSPWDAVIGTFQGNIDGGGDGADTEYSCSFLSSISRCCHRRYWVSGHWFPGGSLRVSDAPADAGFPAGERPGGGRFYPGCFSRF